MKLQSSYQAVWIYAHGCPWENPHYATNKMSKFMVLMDGEGKEERVAREQVADLWRRIRDVLRATPRQERKQLLRLVREARPRKDASRNYASWWEMRQKCRKRIPQYVLQRFARRLKKAGIW